MRTLKLKKFTLTINLVVLFLGLNLVAQDKQTECNIKYNQFKPDVVNKNYDLAYDNWLWVFDNCPDLTINIYKYGMEIAEFRYKNAQTDADKQAAKDLIEKIYMQRLQYYPDENPAKMYSEWAMFKYKFGCPEDKYFELLEKAYKTDPKDMGVVAIPLFYEGIIKRNKDTNVQYIFDMYDNLNDVINAKIEDYSKKLDEIKTVQDSGVELSSKQKNNMNAYTVNLEGMSQVADLITQMSEEYATCDRLIPLYNTEYETHKNDVVWLNRSVSRLEDKNCTDTDFYDKIVEQLTNLDPSAKAYASYANLQLKKGNEAKAIEYFKKAVDLETDSYRKADILYLIAGKLYQKGRLAEARSYAYKALESRPNLGKAYLLIANMYATSANTCGGGDPFGARMVFQAALDKAYKAKSVDPSISTQANRAIGSYSSKAPTKEDVFIKGIAPGSSWKINCWIGETVRVP